VAIDCSVAYGEVTRVPWLRSELERSMQQHITDTMLWPRRIVCPATRDGTVNDTVLPQPQLDELARDDPLLRAFAARDTYSWNNAPTFNKAIGKARTGQDESSAETPGFSINLGVLDFQGVASAVGDFNWTQQLQVARYPLYHAAPFYQATTRLATTLHPLPRHMLSHAAPLLAPTPLDAHPFVALQAAGNDWLRSAPASFSDAQLRNMTSSWQQDVSGAMSHALSDAGDAVNATTTPWRDAVGQGLQAAGSAISGASNAAVQGAVQGLQPAGSALANATVAVTNATAAAGGFIAVAHRKAIVNAQPSIVNATSTISTKSGEMWGGVSSNAISAFELGLAGLPAALPKRQSDKRRQPDANASRAPQPRVALPARLRRRQADPKVQGNSSGAVREAGGELQAHEAGGDTRWREMVGNPLGEMVGQVVAVQEASKGDRSKAGAPIGAPPSASPAVPATASAVEAEAKADNEEEARAAAMLAAAEAAKVEWLAKQDTPSWGVGGPMAEAGPQGTQEAKPQAMPSLTLWQQLNGLREP
jgi:hypothetical protein